MPLGALVSRTHPMLGVGTLSLGSHEALGALRVIGTALATGEAIGVAAAHWLRPRGRGSRQSSPNESGAHIATNAAEARLP